MKKFCSFLLIAAALILARVVSADAVYPYTTPVYLPTANAGSQTFTAPGDYTFSLNGISLATLRVSGTCSSLVGAVQGSNDGTNYTTINASGIGINSNTFSITAPGFWRSNVSGFTRVRFHITALTASCTVTMAGTQSDSKEYVDPCQNPGVAKLSIPVSQTSSTTAALVAASTGKSVYMCAFHATAAGTNPTALIEYGTQTTTACDTGATALTGTMAPSATIGSIDLAAGGISVLSAPASKQLCLVTGATSSVQGVLVYVQQ